MRTIPSFAPYASPEEEVRARLADLLSDPRVQKMQTFLQHSDVTTLEHTLSVAVWALTYVRRHRIVVDEDVLLRAALLHDFCLYDWHVTKHPGHLHGFYHPAVAEENARTLLSEREEVCRAIRSHMFPLTLFHPPTSREAWILCLADKAVASGETFSPARRRRMKERGEEVREPEKPDK